MTLEVCGFEFLREDCELKRREVCVGAGLLAGDAGEEPPGDEAAPSRGAPHVSAHAATSILRRELADQQRVSSNRSGTRFFKPFEKKLWQGQEKCWQRETNTASPARMEP